MQSLTESVRCPHCSFGGFDIPDAVIECPHLIAAVSWPYEPGSDDDFPSWEAMLTDIWAHPSMRSAVDAINVAFALIGQSQETNGDPALIYRARARTAIWRSGRRRRKIGAARCPFAWLTGAPVTGVLRSRIMVDALRNV